MNISLFQSTACRCKNAMFIALLLLVNCHVLVASTTHPPVSALTLTCPADLTIQIPSGDCGAYFNYATLVWSSSVPLADTVFSPPPGTFFEVGTTPVSIAGTDAGGNVQTCTFHLTVPDYTFSTVVCDDQTVIYIDDPDCVEELTASMLLEGLFGCNDNYLVQILTPNGQSLGNMAGFDLVGNTWTVKTTNLVAGSSCWGQISVEPAPFLTIIACPADTSIFCNQPYDPEATGLPIPVWCWDLPEMDVVHTDNFFNLNCDDGLSFRIERQWEATNIFGNATTCTQHIEAKRYSLDDLVFPPDFDGTDSAALACNPSLTLAEQTDTSVTGYPLAFGLLPADPSCDFSIDFQDSILHVCGARYEIMREFTAIDWCANGGAQVEVRVHVQHILVADSTAPEFIATDSIYASLNATCGDSAWVPAAEILYECSGFSIEIIAPWDTLQTNGGWMKIEKNPGWYSLLWRLTDDCGNVSEQETALIIASGVLLNCPSDTLRITCDFFNEHLKTPLEQGDFSVLEQLGTPEYFANCTFTWADTATVNVDACGEGIIHRTMSNYDSGTPLICEQDILVEHVSDWVVQFPSDLTVNCGNQPPLFLQPLVSGQGCEAVQVTFTDQVFNVVPDACYKIVRTWKVVNPCVTGTTQDDEVIEKPENQLGLPFPDCDLDGDGDCDGKTFRDSWRNGDASNRPTAAQASQVAFPDTDPDSDPWDGYIVYEQIIKVQDVVNPVFPQGCLIPDVCVVDNSCVATVMLPTPEVNDCSISMAGGVTINANGQLGSGFGPFFNVTPGTYNVTYLAHDHCNNQKACTTTVKVKDCTPPVALCKMGLVVELMVVDPAMVQVWASDFNMGSTDNCPGTLKLSFSSDVTDIGRTFDCCDIGQQNIELWVTDLAGNQSFCETTVIIQTNMSSCECGPEIFGNLSRENGSGIGNANIEVVKDDSSYVLVSSSFPNGNYIGSTAFPANWSVHPVKNTFPQNGVSTFDAVLLTKHILGSQLLDSPYKIIAADVNHSNSVTTLDAVIIRQMVLQYISAFPDNASWRFVDKNYIFPDPLNPFAEPFPETILLENLQQDTFGVDFIGIKTGDLNLNAIPNLYTGEPEERSGGALHLKSPARQAAANETFTLPLFLEEKPVQGFQFALRFDPEKLELTALQPGFLSRENWSEKDLAAGILPVSWFSEAAWTASPLTPAFSLIFKAKEKGDVGDWVQLDPSILSAEAYSPDLEVLDLQLQFAKNPSGESALAFADPTPNPFTEATILSFFLPAEGVVSLSLSSPDGKAVFSAEHFFEKGWNAWKIERKQLPGAGVWFAEIRTEFGRKTARLMAW